MKRKPKNSLRRAWAKFINGTWVKEFPKKPGTYPIASGTEVSKFPPSILMNVIPTEEGLRYILPGRTSIGSPNWEGWFWSQPLPNLPFPPQEETVETLSDKQ